MRLPIQIGRPQIIAGLALLVLLAECLYFSAELHIDELMVEGEPLLRRWLTFCWDTFGATYIAQFAALPFAIAAVLLGGGVWWVSRRLFGNSGAYVALFSYCLNFYVFFQDLHGNTEVFGAVGAFGFVYTAMGVAHTIYGPSQKWLPRFVLLCTGLLITVVSDWPLALVATLLGFTFLIYLTPGKRYPALILYFLACSMTFLIAQFIHDPNFDNPFGLEASISLAKKVWTLSGVVLITAPLLAVMLVPYVMIKKAHWFGNTSALVAGFVFILVAAAQDTSPTVAVPFLCTFAGGVFADVIEIPAIRNFALCTAGLVLTTESAIIVWAALS